MGIDSFQRKEYPIGTRANFKRMAMSTNDSKAGDGCAFLIAVYEFLLIIQIVP
jgi:hypothetical protein